MSAESPKIREYSSERPDLAQAIAHIYKHSLWTHVFDIHREQKPKVYTGAALSLWDHRHDPEYATRPDAGEISLGKSLDIPSDPKEVDFLLAINSRNSFYQFAEFAETHASPSGEPIVIPRGDALVRPSLLTNTVAAATQEMQNDDALGEYATAAAERQSMSFEEAKRHILANGGYNLFVIGHLLPLIAEGTADEREMLSTLRAFTQIKGVLEGREKIEELLRGTQI